MNYRVEGVNPFYGQDQFLYPVSPSFKSMWGWQNDAFNIGKDARFFATQAFCGSGKSILQINLAIHDIVSSGYKQKQLFVVPQEHIHRGFVADDETDYMSVKQNEVEYQWCVQPEHNFCDGCNRIEGLKKWLLTPPATLAKGFTKTTIGGLNAVCSHSALVIAWGEFSPAQRKRVIRNLTLRVDEAHHLNHVFLDEEEFTVEERQAIENESTQLGKICTFIVNSSVKSCKLHLTTATMYRGDRRIVLSVEVRAKFIEYNLDWIEHFRSLGIKSFYLQYEEYETDPINQIVRKIQAEPNEKHFVVIPSSGHKWRKKGNEYEALLDKLAGFRVLDLVTKKTQEKNKQLLLAEPKTFNPENPSQYDVVVVCMLGREGTDWCPCSRLHNASCESSITLAVQTIGRPFRRYEGKETVQIHHYVKKFKVPDDGITKRELFSDRTNALLVCMQVNDMTNPVLVLQDVFKLPDENDDDDDNEELSRRKTTTLSSIFGDQYENMLIAALEGYESLEDEEKNLEGVFELAGQICDEFGIDDSHENRDNIQNGITARILRETSLAPTIKNINGIDIAFMREAGFDKIECDLQRSIYFGECSETDWQVIRNIIKGDWMVNFEEVKKIGLDNIKVGHPLYGWVKKNLSADRKFRKENGM